MILGKNGTGWCLPLRNVDERSAGQRCIASVATCADGINDGLKGIDERDGVSHLPQVQRRPGAEGAGANDDGAASLEKHVAKAFGGVEQLSKFHSRVFWFAKADKEPPAYWRGLGGLQPVGDDTWLSRPGIFSWDRIDDGSALLARHLPGDIAGTVADFGCGWGYLARDLLPRAPEIAQIHLIDAEHLAIEAARANVPDRRAAFHWLDLTQEAAPATFDRTRTMWAGKAESAQASIR